MSDGAAMVLRHGELFGRRERSVDVGGFLVSALTADPQREIGLHTHETAHFILVTAGSYVTEACGAGASDAPTPFVYNPPGTTHRDCFARVGGIVSGHFLSIGVDAAQMSLLHDAIRLPRESVRLVGGPAHPLAIRIARAVRSGSEDAIGDVEALCLELVGAAADGRATSTAAPSWLVRARELLHDRVADNLTIREVARAVGTHPVHLARAFRRSFGCAPTAYVRRIRLDRAQHLLHATDVPIARVAFECGFADQSHMTRAFQRAFGLTPGTFRRETRGAAHRGHVSPRQDGMAHRR